MNSYFNAPENVSIVEDFTLLQLPAQHIPYVKLVLIVYIYNLSRTVTYLAVMNTDKLVEMTQWVGKSKYNTHTVSLIVTWL